MRIVILNHKVIQREELLILFEEEEEVLNIFNNIPDKFLGRRSRAEIEAEALLMERNNNEQANQARKNSSHMEEEDDDEISFNYRRRGTNRRSSRILIEEEEKEENKREEEEEHYGSLRRTERRNRPRPVDVLAQSQRRTRGGVIEENPNRRLRIVGNEERNTRASAMQIEEESRENMRGPRSAMMRNLRERHFTEGGRLSREGPSLQQATRLQRNRVIDEETFEEKVCSRCG